MHFANSSPRHHYLTLLLNGKLVIAPISPDIQGKVLDVGTGTGETNSNPYLHRRVVNSFRNMGNVSVAVASLSRPRMQC